MDNLEHSMCVLLEVLEKNVHSIRVFKGNSQISLQYDDTVLL